MGLGIRIGWRLGLEVDARSRLRLGSASMGLCIRDRPSPGSTSCRRQTSSPYPIPTLHLHLKPDPDPDPRSSPWPGIDEKIETDFKEAEEYVVAFDSVRPIYDVHRTWNWDEFKKQVGQDDLGRPWVRVAPRILGPGAIRNESLTAALISF